MNQPKIIQRKTTCNRDCPDACGIVATIEDNRIVRIGGDPDHPVTQGFLCKRTSRYLKRQYHPSRVTQPMVRTDKKSGSWQTISLDDALDIAAEKLLHFRDTFGAASILNYRCGGSMGIMKSVTDFFFQEFGPTTIKWGDICAGAGDAAQERDFGTADSNHFFDLQNAKTILLWGKNVYVSHVHLIPELKKAKANGARLILIDPVQHRSAGLCDDYVQVTPGGDAALAFAMARLARDKNRWEPTAREYCDHLDAYTELLQSKSAIEWAAMAGVSEHQLELLTDAYTDGPSTVLVGWGMQRRPNGAAIVRAIDALACVTGNIGIAGGCVSFYFARKSAYNLSFVDKELAPRTIPEALLGRGIIEANDPPIKMVWCSAGNPVATMPESNTTRRALMERYTVVVDCFLTDTAECADLFIPTTTMLEDNDLLGAYGHHFIAESRPLVQPPADVLTDYEILNRLAPRVGVGGMMLDDIETWKRRLLKDVESQGISLESLRDGAVQNPVSPQIVFEGRKFETETGRANLVHRYDHPAPRTSETFPLRLMAIATDKAQASQWQPEEQVGPAPMIVHPESASAFSDGDLAIVESRLDRLTVQLQFDSNQRTDVAIMEKGGWLSTGRCSNSLTTAELTDEGGGAVYYDTPVRILPLDSDSTDPNAGEAE